MQPQKNPTETRSHNSKQPKDTHAHPTQDRRRQLETKIINPKTYEPIEEAPRPRPDVRQKLQQVFVGDVVVFKNPLAPDKHLVRRVVADGGYEMASTDEKDEPFILNDEEFWVLSDNKDLKKGEAEDSRAFGPIALQDIVGRVIYRMQSPEDHGPVDNSKESNEDDEVVLDVELDINEMAKSSKP